MFAPVSDVGLGSLRSVSTRLGYFREGPLLWNGQRPRRCDVLLSHRIYSVRGYRQRRKLWNQESVPASVCFEADRAEHVVLFIAVGLNCENKLLQIRCFSSLLLVPSLAVLCARLAFVEDGIRGSVAT